MATLISPSSPPQLDYFRPSSSTVIDMQPSPLSLLVEACKNIGKESSIGVSHRTPSASSDVTLATEHFRSGRRDSSKSDANVVGRSVERKRKTTSGTSMTTSLFNCRPMTSATRPNGYSYGESSYTRDSLMYDDRRNGFHDTVEFNPSGCCSSTSNSTTMRRGGRDSWHSMSDSSLAVRPSTDESLKSKNLGVSLASTGRSPLGSSRRVYDHNQNGVSKTFQTAYADVEYSDLALLRRNRPIDLPQRPAPSTTTQSPMLYTLAHQLYGAATLAVPDVGSVAGLSQREALVSYLSSDVGAGREMIHEPLFSVCSHPKGFLKTGSGFQLPPMFPPPKVSPDCIDLEPAVDGVHPLLQQAAAVARYRDWYGRLADANSAVINGITSSQVAPINLVQSIHPSTSSTPTHSPTTSYNSGGSCYRRCSTDVRLNVTPAPSVFRSTSGPANRQPIQFASMDGPPSNFDFVQSSSSQQANNSSSFCDLHVCSWLSSSTGSFCGRRFADADSLFHHLRSHCNDQRDSSALSVASRLFAQYASEVFQATGSSASTSTSSPFSSLYPIHFGSSMSQVEDEYSETSGREFTSSPSSSTSRYHPYRSTINATRTGSHENDDILGRQVYQRRQTVGMAAASSALQSAAAMRL